MATQTATAKKDVLNILTDEVIERLRKGLVPWRASWTDAGLPENLISHNAYRGINRVLLASLGYERNVFVTSRQLKDLGGTLVPEERPHVVGYLSNGKRNKDGTSTPVPPEASGVKEPLKLRFYTVFNVSQCSFPSDTAIPPIRSEMEPLQKIVEVRSKDKTAYYDPLKDYVNVPKESAFTSKEEYCLAEFHQLVHATGHHSRLDRRDLIQMSEYGYDAFSHEELVAEIGASYLMSHFGLTDPFVPTPEYLAGWIKKLEGNKWLMFSAAQQAEKAINFLFIGEVATEDMKIE